MSLNKKAKTEIDNCVKQYEIPLGNAYDEATFFTLYNSLGYILSDISKRYNNSEVDKYLNIQVDFLFGTISNCLS